MHMYVSTATCVLFKSIFSSCQHSLPYHACRCKATHTRAAAEFLWPSLPAYIQNQCHKFHLVECLYQASCSSISCCSSRCLASTPASHNSSAMYAYIYTHLSNPAMHYGRNSWPMVGYQSTLLLACKTLYLSTLF